MLKYRANIDVSLENPTCQRNKCLKFLFWYHLDKISIIVDEPRETVKRATPCPCRFRTRERYWSTRVAELLPWISALVFRSTFSFRTQGRKKKTTTDKPYVEMSITVSNCIETKHPVHVCIQSAYCSAGTISGRPSGTRRLYEDDDAGRPGVGKTDIGYGKTANARTRPGAFWRAGRPETLSK